MKEGSDMIQLKEVTRENFWDCIELTVSDDQSAFVTTNAVSIAQSKVQPECIPLAVYDDETMVGFVMYCIDEDDGEYWIYRMMIDKKYQSKGYGRKAFQKLLEIIKEDKTHHTIFLGVHKESIPAVKLYQSFGFTFNGQVFGNEHIMRLEY
jgi:diamine N-acetyltransferase